MMSVKIPVYMEALMATSKFELKKGISRYFEDIK